MVSVGEAHFQSVCPPILLILLLPEVQMGRMPLAFEERKRLRKEEKKGTPG